jgi:hypothetical protein
VLLPPLLLPQHRNLLATLLLYLVQVLALVASEKVPVVVAVAAVVVPSLSPGQLPPDSAKNTFD